MQWRNIGPFRGGRSTSVSGVASNPMVYYFGSAGGGIWQTEDAGLSWKNISDDFFSSSSIGVISVATSDPNLIYAGTGEHAVRGVMTSHGDGLYRSTDAGKSWTYLGLPDARHIAEIVIHPQQPDIVYVAVQGALYDSSRCRGVYKTEDGGKSWRQVLFVDETTGACDLSIDPGNPRILYAAMWDHQRKPWQIRSGGPGSGLYKSVDGGENWQVLSQGLPPAMGKIGLAVSPTNTNRLYANIEAEKGGIFRSDDGGESWRQTSSDRRTIGRAWYFTELTADPQDPETVYVLNEQLLRSIDGGFTFEAIATPHEDQHDLWINPAHPSNLILANDGGTAITFNSGQTWSTQYNQPTGQFYRVIADNGFPYSIYGAQQDNSSVRIASRSNGPGIGIRDWEPVAGCESGFLAFDPDDPTLIYGGCYQGRLEEYDQRTKEVREVSAFPAFNLGAEARSMRYRFNWNAPVITQPQDARILYHAANVVLRSSDGGQQWEEISPDLTRNDKSRQGPGGIPFTNEGAGAENYNTISYLAGSPHRAGVIWAGSDDGLVHLSRDEGQNWEDVTPEGLGEALINSIEVSPHRPAAAYVVATRYRFGDLRPLIYYTDDFGQHWQLITDGIGKDHFSRVVREDPRKAGLLYAGTERGLYISFNNGRRWHPFPLNLPVCPITDLCIRDNDLIAATAGRAFWILDDLSPLQESMGELRASQAMLFQPKPSYRLAGTAAPTANGLGQNPLPGMIIDYFLPEEMNDDTLTLEIIDAQDHLIRTFTNQQNSSFLAYEGGPPAPMTLPSVYGINRFFWDLRREPLPGIPQVFIPGDYRAGLVAPGEYRLRLTIGSDTLEQPCRLLADPRLSAGPDDYHRQQETLRELEKTIIDLHQSVNRMRAINNQVAFLTEHLKKAGSSKDLISKGRAIQEKITTWEEGIIQTRQLAELDLINFPNRLNAKLLYLLSRTDTHDPRITGGIIQYTEELLQEWQQSKAVMEEIMEQDIHRFNRLFKDKNIPVVMIPSSAD